MKNFIYIVLIMFSGVLMAQENDIAIASPAISGSPVVFPGETQFSMVIVNNGFEDINYSENDPIKITITLGKAEIANIKNIMQSLSGEIVPFFDWSYAHNSDGDDILRGIQKRPLKAGFAAGLSIKVKVLELVSEPQVGFLANVQPSFEVNNRGNILANDGLFRFTVSALDSDGDSIADITDVDDDNDGILDTVEGDTDSDKDGLVNSLDVDSDNDGILDVIEAQSSNSFVAYENTDEDKNGLSDVFQEGFQPIDTDKDEKPDYLDLDSDNDSVVDATEAFDFDFDGEADDLMGEATKIVTTISAIANSVTETEYNFRNADDDNDQVLTIEEDTNKDGILANDDSDQDQYPDYLDQDVVCKAGLDSPIVDNSEYVICADDQFDLSTVMVSNIPEGAKVVWHNDALATGYTAVSNITAVEAGVYYVSFFDEANGCFSGNGNATTAVQVSSRDISLNYQDEVSFNEGESFQLELDGVTETDIVEWSSGEQTTSIEYLPHGDSAVGVTVQTAEGCVFEKSVRFKLNVTQPSTSRISKMYPSPATAGNSVLMRINTSSSDISSTKLTNRVSKTTKENVFATIYNMSGSVVQRPQQFEVEKGNIAIDFKLSYLPSGKYIIRLVGNGWSESKQLIID